MNALATLLFVPALLSVKAGQEFTLDLVAVAATTTGAVEAKIAYDTALVAAERFTLAPSFVEVDKRGYRAIDVARGTLTETAGYPGGFLGTTTLGSITFKAKAAGKATIVVAGASVMLDAHNENVFGGRAGGAVVEIVGQGNAKAPAELRSAGAAVSATLAPLVLTAAPVLAPHDWLALMGSWLARRLHF